MTHFQCLIVLLALKATADGQTVFTNNVFSPQEMIASPERSIKQTGEMNVSNQLEAIKQGECLPAEQDLSGHWGEACDGFQFSLRAVTNTFVEGEPIAVSVTVRNITETNLSILTFSPGLDTEFHVQDQSGNWKQIPSVAGSVYNPELLSARHQIKFEHNLADRLLFPPGIYKIYAERMVFNIAPASGKWTNMTNISSGVLEIKVVAH
jgi:hypothetical protein